jgi:DNA-binding SARP family transcriptional activator
MKAAAPRRQHGLRILGPLQVLEGGAQLPLGKPRECVVLAALLLHANEPVSREAAMQLKRALE